MLSRRIRNMTTEERIQGHLMDPLRQCDSGTGLNILNPAERVECVDGFTISIQAGYGIYCEPRQSEGPWRKVELGFPSAGDDLILKYAEDADAPAETVYGYVPIDVVVQLIDKHGGLK